MFNYYQEKCSYSSFNENGIELFYVFLVGNGIQWW